jgi:hypothetical protein
MSIPRRMTAAAAAAILLAASLAGCSAKDKPSTGPTPKQPTAWQAVLGQIKEDGTVTKDTALAAFAVAIGPVPGGTAPSGAADTIPSGTLAVSWVFRHWSELSADQRSAVFNGLGIPAEAPKEVRNAPAAYRAPTKQKPENPNIPCLSADSAGAEKYRAWVPGIESDITAKLGRSLSIDKSSYIAVNSKDLEMPALMYTYPCEQTATGNKVKGCTIHINPNAVGGKYTDDMVRSYLIHEYVHCYLFDKLGFAYGTMPAWYVEGAPTWAMSVLGVANDRLSGTWTDYLDTPEKPLSQRAYDGVGFFAHLAETGTDPWSVLDPIGAAMAGGKGTSAGWKAAGVTPSFLDSWAAGRSRAGTRAPPGPRPVRTCRPTPRPCPTRRSATAARCRWRQRPMPRRYAASMWTPRCCWPTRAPGPLAGSASAAAPTPIWVPAVHIVR